jgi:N6-adenosine-specific RNA methylase IME4
LVQGAQGRRPGRPGGGILFPQYNGDVAFRGARKNARTLAPARSQVNVIRSRKQEHSRKPDEQYDIIESCSPGPRLELFARGTRPGWTTWGNQAEDYAPTWATYANHSGAEKRVGTV